MYETYQQNEREWKEDVTSFLVQQLAWEKTPESEVLHKMAEDRLNKLQSHNRLSLIKVMKALEKELEGEKINYVWDNGECSFCGFEGLLSDTHECSVNNEAIQLSIDKIREFIKKLEK